MKTNIIHVLILAIILIAGWSLFTILQDVYNPNSLKYDDHSMIGRGRQYLPLTPESYSRQQKYPVYKVPAHVQTQMAKDQSVNSKISYRVVSNGIALNANNKISQESNVPTRPLSNALHSTQNTNGSSIAAGDLSKASTLNSNIGSSFSDGNRIMNALRSAIDGNAIERGKRKGKNDPYNSVPVGDGWHLLMLMGVVYAIFRVYKK